MFSHKTLFINIIFFISVKISNHQFKCFYVFISASLKYQSDNFGITICHIFTETFIFNSWFINFFNGFFANSGLEYHNLKNPPFSQNVDSREQLFFLKTNKNCLNFIKREILMKHLNLTRVLRQCRLTLSGHLARQFSQ